MFVTCRGKNAPKFTIVIETRGEDDKILDFGTIRKVRFGHLST